ncbi:HEPN domain-containing protein [Marinicellulosiphila megalodicopiae]|uniref:HEPN domain-containing protein n=1 Tax=Marinicellulosiphila megalodicopiae TaxID=2724896 RepID=UPI003BB19CD3
MASQSRSRSRHQAHDKYRQRINQLFNTYEKVVDLEEQAHSAKYLAVLISGYLEQAIKELLLHYTSQGAMSQISNYVEQTWPISRNMKTQNIKMILSQFDEKWGDDFQCLFVNDEKKKGHINSIVEWRNSIAHGKEGNTLGVTIVSVKQAFKTIIELVTFVESKVKPQ